MPPPAKRRTAAKPLPPPTASEAAFEKLLAAFDAPREKHESGAAAFLNELYANSKRYADRDPYATIGDSPGFNTKVVGITFEGRQDLAAGIRPGEVLELVRE